MKNFLYLSIHNRVKSVKGACKRVHADFFTRFRILNYFQNSKHFKTMDIKKFLEFAVPMLVVLIIYDMVVKGFVGGLFNKYDDTLNRFDHFSEDAIINVDAQRGRIYDSRVKVKQDEQDFAADEIHARLNEYKRVRSMAA